jgi:hypothetical protein
VPRKRPAHLVFQKTRHDKKVWYFRKGHGPRVRLPGNYNSSEFWAAYNAALVAEAAAPGAPGGKAPAASKVLETQTLRWLIGQYRESGDW